MRTFPFKKIDAFTSGASAGNPCACIYLKDAAEITAAEMQCIARELRGYVNEVVYLFPEDQRFRLMYYSAECEVDFCGHGTIGVMYDYIGSHPELLARDRILIRVKDETLDVHNRIADEDCVFITAPVPSFSACALAPCAIAEALSTRPESLDESLDPELISAGLQTLVVPLCGLDPVLSILPDEALLKRFCLENGLDIILVFTGHVADARHQFRTRVFAPKFGYLEDPATGSGNAAFGYYLLKRNLWNGNSISIEQNGSLECPNTVQLDTVEKAGERRVLFGGAAQVKVEGLYRLLETAM